MRVRQAREAADAERLRLEKEARLQKKREAKAKAKGKYIYRQIGIQLENSGLNWYDGRHSTTKLRKFICTFKATFNLLTRLSLKKKSHNTSLHSKLEGLPFVG